MEKLKVILVSVIFLLGLITGCKKPGASSNPSPTGAQNLVDVTYGPNARNVADVYLPEKRDLKAPVILLVHGGSWFEGDKTAFTDLAKYWREKGYTAVTLNYRLTHTAENNIHPAQVNDIAKAIEFISGKAGEWGISNTKFVLQGASAGGHLALLYSYKYDAANKVKAVISMAGPTNLTSIIGAGPAQTQVVQWLIGATIQANPVAYAEASPLTHVTKQSTPTLLFHGKRDIVVPYQQSVDLTNRLTQVGAVNKLVLYEDSGHEVINENYMAAFLSECENWFKQHVND